MPAHIACTIGSQTFKSMWSKQIRTATQFVGASKTCPTVEAWHGRGFFHHGLLPSCLHVQHYLPEDLIHVKKVKKKQQGSPYRGRSGTKAKGLSFCRGVMGLVLQEISKHTGLKHIVTTDKERERERKRERERQREREITAKQIRPNLGGSELQSFELHVACFSRITTCFMFSWNPKDS